MAHLLCVNNFSSGTIAVLTLFTLFTVRDQCILIVFFQYLVIGLDLSVCHDAIIFCLSTWFVGDSVSKFN